MAKSSTEKKLDEILKLERLQIKLQKRFEALEKKQIQEDKRIQQLEIKQTKKQEKILDLEEKQLEELEDIEKLEKEIRDKVTKKPLKKITYKDLGKAAIGAFIGIVSHFTILKGVHFAETISMTKATSFLIVSFLIGMVILYYTGFRRVHTFRILKVMPLRLSIIYLTTIVVIVAVLFIFGAAHDGHELYKQVAVASLPAIVGACAADLIGEE